MTRGDSGGVRSSARMDQSFIGRSRSFATSVARGLTCMRRSSSDGHTPSRFRDRGARRAHTVIARSPSDGNGEVRSSPLCEDT